MLRELLKRRKDQGYDAAAMSLQNARRRQEARRKVDEKRTSYSGATIKAAQVDPEMPLPSTRSAEVRSLVSLNRTELSLPMAKIADCTALLATMAMLLT